MKTINKNALNQKNQSKIFYVATVRGYSTGPKIRNPEIPKHLKPGNVLSIAHVLHRTGTQK